MYESVLNPQWRVSGVGGWLAFYVITCLLGAVWFFMKQLGTHSKPLLWMGAAIAHMNIAGAILILCKARLALPVVAIQFGLRFLSYAYVIYLDSRIHRLANPYCRNRYGMRADRVEHDLVRVLSSFTTCSQRVWS